MYAIHSTRLRVYLLTICNDPGVEPVDLTKHEQFTVTSQANGLQRKTPQARQPAKFTMKKLPGRRSRISRQMERGLCMRLISGNNGTSSG